MRNAVHLVVRVKAPQQLSMALDSREMKGISVAERSAVIALLARLLTEAAGIESEESGDDRR